MRTAGRRRRRGSTIDFNELYIIYIVIIIVVVKSNPHQRAPLIDSFDLFVLFTFSFFFAISQTAVSSRERRAVPIVKALASLLKHRRRRRRPIKSYPPAFPRPNNYYYEILLFRSSVHLSASYEIHLTHKRTDNNNYKLCN